MTQTFISNSGYSVVSKDEDEHADPEIEEEVIAFQPDEEARIGSILNLLSVPRCSKDDNEVTTPSHCGSLLFPWGVLSILWKPTENHNISDSSLCQLGEANGYSTNDPSL